MTAIATTAEEDNICVVGLYKNHFLPKNLQIVGYARSAIELDDFRKRVSSKIKVQPGDDLEGFINRCTYVSGKYDVDADYEKLAKFVDSVEVAVSGKRNRLFYLALPPNVFADASKGISKFLHTSKGQNQLIVEKPFGRDFETSKALSKSLAQYWKEDEIYRIDHYLGKEMVKNIMILRFANIFFGAVWNRFYIHNVQITFKEDIGTEGRGGYFDEFGIIRDVMQNHLLQILSIIGMEKPVSLDAEDVRDEKVKVLRCIAPLTMDDVLLGQYTKSLDGKEEGYLEDPTVPKGSNCPTFAAAVFYIHNERWDGVPFIMKCGKALNERKAEIRIQFADVPGNIYGVDVARNELVLRVQPDEAVYMKFMNKQPGLSKAAVISELDLSYKRRFNEHRIPEAYESLILDAMKGDRSNFVRDDELDAAWKIFTPLLHRIEKDNIKPEKYAHGSRGPESLDSFISKHGYQRSHLAYEWKAPSVTKL
ncbi:glucose-6-phosphate dehydrogenase (NADP+) [Synchytrium microbalum]|uniref:Glucose-6-phosphate 1-dehydrogenase n=1 Tax=Synchytrium microbalum TaxID=1806994 RepID=A0A507C120_9FUNG|nr:glucose-6-phosphate dehydrogenase (NADP+) [Synchytrium microbalum]TPX32749.1 glucose-6-phosphate dehydrogenase (NADP+) [Synchytrium microbalum]